MFVPSKISRLSALAGSTTNTQDNVARMGRFLQQGALAAVCMWISLLLLVWWVAPSSSYERLEGMERNACILVFVLLGVTNTSRLLPLLFRDKNTLFLKTGAMVGSCTVQLIALCSVAILILFPTPVLIDPITLRRVHLVRWAEWTPLAFLMTFLTEGIDMPNATNDINMSDRNKSTTTLAWTHAIAIALSTSAGLIFPFCTSLTMWMFVFILSCILFSSLYIRLYQRTQRFRATSRGTTVEEQEHYDRVRLSLRLLQACATAWTLLVLGFVVCCFAPDDESVVLLRGVQQQDKASLLYSWWSHPALPLVTENFFEVGSKIWYLMLILDVHELVFDEGSRAVRRLEEMRDIMAVIWDSTSDAIALCVKGNKSNIINAVVSPTFLKMSEEETQTQAHDENIALVFEVTPNTNSNKHTNATPKHKVVAMNMSSPVTLQVMKQSSYLNKVGQSSRSTVKKNIASMAKLIAKSWDFTDTKESLLMHELYGTDNATNEERAIQCEAKITTLETNAVVIVLRDISERFQRLEAEKQLVIEVTERKKDAEANRFTRHEVKNGLLAAIGLVDTMRESLTSSTSAGGEGTATSSVFADYMANRRRGVPQISEDPASNTARPMPRTTSDLSLTSSEGGSEHGGGDCRQALKIAQSMGELDYTLREILDTVMSEAMAREVVHEVYEPRKERVDVPSVLYGRREPSSSGTERFPLQTLPSPFPQLLLDPQLLRYIHRNAVSNACKYGKEGGPVKTEIYFDGDKKEFQMKVINLPGDRHADLVKLGQEAVKTVFAAGTRLHESLDSFFGSLNEALVSSSAGDGAWIMQKCAVTLGGDCNIQFQDDRTVFSLTCPAAAYYPKQTNQGAAADDLQQSGRFCLPENTWGIAIDDSGIQRKLLGRFLSLAGVEKSKRKVMGKDADEVFGFNDYLLETIRNHPDDRFLVIVDENLDILDGGAHQKTVSGSLCVKRLREQMDAADESRLLALVRSANDSKEDVALYKSRAHGFLPKAPIQKDRVLELIQPWWAKRFPSQELASSPSLVEDEEDDHHDSLLVSSVDLMKSVEVIDALVNVDNEAALKARWPAIREKIHALKGDIKTMKSNARVTTILHALEKLRGQSLPDELLERWKLIRSLIVSIL